MKIKLLTVAMLSTSLFLTACGGDDNGTTVFVPKPEIPENNIQDPVVGMPKNYELNGMAAADVSSDSVVMTYKMLGVNNNEVQATALVFTPPASVVQPTNGWPIVVWAHGTTGVADKCAPSRQGLGGNEVLLKALLASGYVVVAPDYEGLGEPSEKDAHPFLNVKSEAYSITDAVVAARAYLTSLNKKTNGQWMTVGHSQGGQAALGAAQYASRAKLDYKGTVAVAPASNLKSILEKGELLAIGQPNQIQIALLAPLDTFTALITAGLKNQNPSLTFSEVFNSPTDLIAATAETSSGNSACYDVLGDRFKTAMNTYLANNNTLEGYPRTKTNFMNIASISKFLSTDSQPLQKKVSTPIIIYQGTADATVPKEATDALVLSARTIGTLIPDANYRVGAWDHTTAYSTNIGKIVQDVNILLPSNQIVKQ
ncbi:alpha/beta fold hydrolase [uncultured Acinetobacter sp.]|uniref:alpha/beta fold hydrolase n=1 Tax=uncultured Acinetobacter sp. TaxID=165433 RepID=UPI00258E44FE|nr:alpha/beta fold hydrolase [uncultured Acinetobacter sp.]